MTKEQVWESVKVGEWLDAKFYDRETGEIFLVELKKKEDECIVEFIAKCQAIADENFNCAIFMALLFDTEAEILGYDTY